MDRWTRITEKGLRFAMKLSDQVQAVHVDAEDCRDDVEAMWQRNVAAPIQAANKPVPELVFLSSPFRFVLFPLVDHILKVEHDHPERQIAVLVPELVVKHWWQTPLHNPGPETPPAGPRQSAHHSNQHPLVPLRLLVLSCKF
jgi:hypothetical protein